VLINEIAWMGTLASPSDQWIELYNPTSEDINLEGWLLYSSTEPSFRINLSGTAYSGSYYLIEAGDDSVVSDVQADLVSSFGSGLHSSGDSLYLAKVGQTGTTISDEVSQCDNWCGNGLRTEWDVLSMERKSGNRAPGTDWTAWTTWGEVRGELSNGYDRTDGTMGATPARENGERGVFAM
jgi:hypothetical protein